MKRFLFVALLSVALLGFSGAGKLFAVMQVWEGWGNFGIFGEPEPEVSMSACDAMDITAVDAIGFVYHRVSDRARNATHIGWRWRIDEGPDPTFLGQPKQDRPVSIHLIFEPPESRGSYSEWQLWLSGFPKEAHVLTYVWGSANAPGSIVVNPYHERGRLIVLRNGLGGYGNWQSERVDIRGDFENLFGKPFEELAYVVVSSDTDDSDSVAKVLLRDIFFEDGEGERFSPCGSEEDS
ncbi:MAG: DUF3047 domain-containing protein [Hyphomicrobiales bacterium]|nr:DUF3047 domain-containing protein [Hyphomicrobiales bacterium]MCY4048752.1 DUF3047 domain-containing protein [Hyphomicrobiales bacterium]MCY4053768.1 DUF3047 domain-containing protein [Hyphomicrobiales bacterium]